MSISPRTDPAPFPNKSLDLSYRDTIADHGTVTNSGATPQLRFGLRRVVCGLSLLPYSRWDLPAFPASEVFLCLIQAIITLATHIDAMDNAEMPMDQVWIWVILNTRWDRP